MAGMDAKDPAAPAGALGKYDLSFELTEPEAYRKDVPKAQVHVLDAGHFALDTAADEIAELVRRFMSNTTVVRSARIAEDYHQKYFLATRPHLGKGIDAHLSQDHEFDGVHRSGSSERLRCRLRQ